MDIQQLHSRCGAALPSDPVASIHLNNTSDPRWATRDGLLLHNERIYVPDATDLRLRVLQDKHDHQLAGHWGQNKTLAMVRQEYVWPGLRDFVVKYVSSCVPCKRNKYVRHRPYGLLRQLPVPDRPWDSISMDLIEQLPMSNGFTAILVIVDQLSKQGIFIPTTDKITVSELANLFVLHVFSKHRVPNHVTSDRGSEFISHFFRSLGEALGMKLHFTTGWHPSADGQTKHVNQTLEQYIRMYCNYQQDNWAPLLPLRGFVYNNTPTSTTGVSPFFANKGYNPSVTVHPERDLTSARAREFVTDLDELHSELRRQMAAAQKRYQGPADKRRTPDPKLSIGDEVYINADGLPSLRRSKAFSQRYHGPFEVIAQPGPASYTLKLPHDMRLIHPVFHISQLEIGTPNTIPGRIQPPPLPVEIEGELEYEIAEILSSKLDRRRKPPLMYLVRWTGYAGTSEETSWLKADELDHATDLVAEFHAKYPDLPGPR